MKKRSSAVLLSILLITALTFGMSGCAASSQGPSVRSNQNDNSTANTLDKTPDQSSSAGQKDTAKTFTLDQLTKYDGKDGNPAYVAVDGIVYDVSSDRAWHNGQHEEYQAGTDLTEDMANSPHGNMVLKNVPVVGKLAK